MIFQNLFLIQVENANIHTFAGHFGSRQYQFSMFSEDSERLRKENPLAGCVSLLWQCGDEGSRSVGYSVVSVLSLLHVQSVLADFCACKPLLHCCILGGCVFCSVDLSRLFWKGIRYLFC